MSEDELNPLLAPYTNLENRKIPLQDDGMRGMILTVYLIFLIIGVPIWWYLTSSPSNNIPSIHFSRPLSEFTVNVNFEGGSNNMKDYSMAIGNYFFNIKTSDSERLTNENKNLNIIFGKEIKKIDSRTLKVPSSIDLKIFLKDIVNSFKVPNLQKSEIKLKFTILTTNTETDVVTFNNLNNFISNLSPVLGVKPSVHKKYLDETFKFTELTAEMFIGSNPIAKIDTRDERGRTDIFNLVLLKTNTDPIELKTLYIPNWGIIVTTDLSRSRMDQVEKIFISGLKRFLGFPKDQNLPEKFEIELWTEKLKEFYFEKFSEMSKLLNSRSSNVVNVNSSKEAFDIIESIYNDPKLLSAAYFPDDHKFAVYLPVYLPLVLPILVGLITIVKELKERRKRAKKEEERGGGGDDELKVKKE